MSIIIVERILIMNALHSYVDGYDLFLDEEPSTSFGLVLELAEQTFPEAKGWDRQTREQFMRNFFQLENELNARIAEVKEGKTREASIGEIEVPICGRGGCAEDLLAGSAVLRDWKRRVRADADTLKRALAAATYDLMMISRELNGSRRTNQLLGYVCLILGFVVLVLWARR